MILNCQEYMNWKEENTYDNLMDLVADYKRKFNTQIKLITGHNDVGYSTAYNTVSIRFTDETELELNVHEYINKDRGVKYSIKVDYKGNKEDFICLAELIDSYVDL